MDATVEEMCPECRGLGYFPGESWPGRHPDMNCRACDGKGTLPNHHIDTGPALGDVAVVHAKADELVALARLVGFDAEVTITDRGIRINLEFPSAHNPVNG